ncbi:hypothetical protein T492DRAFT_894803, partial [Pavlovales sp. CCMP2436]
VVKLDTSNRDAREELLQYFCQSFHRATALHPAAPTLCTRKRRFVFGFLNIHHFYQLPTSA